MIESRIEQDLKSAMLARDTVKVSTLRGIKSVFLYAKVDAGTRDKELDDEVAIKLLQKEAKKREESAALYSQGGEADRANQEIQEKQIIDTYLPTKINEAELTLIVDKVINDSPEANIGQIIGQIKSQTVGSADGSDIARIVKARLDR